jgi:lysophospholipase L1-like esterase
MIILVFFITNTFVGNLFFVNKAYAEVTDYEGEETFPFGSTLKFDFGSAESPVEENYTKITTESIYDSSLGYGWQNTSDIILNTTNDNTDDSLKTDYISGINIRNEGEDSTNYVTYDCPTFVADLPVGYYKVKLIQGSNTDKTCSGAYIEGDMSIMPWANDAFGTSFAVEPTDLIEYEAGSYAENDATVAVWDGQLTVQIATSITPEGESGTAIINAIEIERIEHNLNPSENPTIITIGDSTVADYPPFDNPDDYSPIPEQTGWGGTLSNFFDGAEVKNWGVGGISARNYITQNFMNRVLMEINPGDIVTVEWGINEAASGRRYVAPTSDDFDPYIQTYIDAIKAFGGIPILISATSGSTGYSDRLKAVANSNNVDYIDLKSLWSDYKSERSSTEQGYLTVDGIHPSRIGGTVIGQLVSYEIKNFENTQLEELNSINISTPVTEYGVVPTAIPENFQVKKQTKSSVTFTWDMEESTLYDPTQLITRFPIYQKEAGADDSTYTEIAEGTAYVTPDLTSPNLSITIQSEGDYEYKIASRGVNGTSEKSSSISVSTYEETSTDIINNGIKYFEGLFSSDFTIKSYNKLSKAVDKGKEALEDESNLDYYADKITNSIESLECKMDTNLYEDFQSVNNENWDTTQDPNGVNMTYNIDEDGDRYLNYYVSASGERSRRKTFDTVDSSKISLEFEWDPGNPDNRNVTELRFYGITGSEANASDDLFFGLKTASNGNIGYYASNEVPPVNTSEIESPGVDLGISNTELYKVKIDFDFDNHEASLTFKPINSDTDETIVKSIEIPSNITSFDYMRWHAARGKNDSGGNDLSVLWNTSIDDFTYYYVSSEEEIDTTKLSNLLEKAKSYEESEYTKKTYAKLETAINSADRVLSDLVIVQEDVDYCEKLLKKAIKNLKTAPLSDNYKFDFGTGEVEDDYTKITSDSLKADTNRYGFVGETLEDFNRDTSDNLTSDGVLVSENTEFEINLPDEDYEVAITYGDPTSSSNAGTTTNITTSDLVEYTDNFNTIKSSSTDIAEGETKIDNFSISVFDGVLRIIFTGTDIKINSIVILPLEDDETVDTKTLYLLGDSTVTSKEGTTSGPDSSGNIITAQFVGWGKNLANYFTDDIIVSNHAVGGRGIRGFYAENRMDAVLTDINPGDYVAIQFGHNDANTTREGRYSTIPEFEEYLEYTCEAVKSRGATPILITVLTHIRDFDESDPSNSDGYTLAPYTSTDQINKSFVEYAQATRDIAKENNIYCYDLNEESYNLFKSEGIDWVKEKVITVDGVHPIADTGANYLANMITDGFAKLNIEGLSNKVLANKTTLQEAADKANEYDLSLYTDRSVKKFEKALDKIYLLIEDENALEVDAIKAIKNLDSAIEKLKLKK